MNFRDYIFSDIDEKKVFLNTLPQNTKPRRSKYNESVDGIKEEYNGYKEMIANYINYKYDKLMPVKVDKNIEDKCKELLK